MGRKKDRSEVGATKGKGKMKMAVRNSVKVAESFSKIALKGEDAIPKKSSSRARKRSANRAKKAQQNLRAKEKLSEATNDSDSDDESPAESKKLKLFDDMESETDDLEPENDEQDSFPEDEVDSGDESDESIITKSKAILKNDKIIKEAAEKELQLNIQREDVDSDDDEQYLTKAQPADFKTLKAQISAKLDLLNKPKAFSKYQDKLRELGESPPSKNDLIARIQDDLQSYYSYNSFLMKCLMDLFSHRSVLDFLEASEVERPLTIRTNTLKTRRKDLAQALINRGVNLDPLADWTKVGLVIFQSQVPIGATPEYLAGHYVIQGASSMLPVIALAPKSDEKILDLCAAPGMKTSYIAQLMKNTGTLVANDANPNRCKAVVGNLHRSGVINTVNQVCFLFSYASSKLLLL